MPILALNGFTSQARASYAVGPTPWLLQDPNSSTVYTHQVATGHKMWRDALRFKSPTVIEVASSISSPSWTTSGAPSAASITSLMDGRADSGGVTLTTALPAIRFTFSGLTSVYVGQILIAFQYSPGTTVQAIWETSPDGTTWTTLLDSGAARSISSRWLMLTAVDNGAAYSRLTIYATFSGSTTAAIPTIQGLSSRPGDQGVSESTDQPYTWDGYKNVSFWADLSQMLSTGARAHQGLYERALPTTVGDTINVAALANVGGANAVVMELDVVVGASGFATTKRYVIPTNYTGTSGVWQVVRPVAGSQLSTTNDFQLEITATAGTATLRLRRTAGTSAATAVVRTQVTSYGGGSTTVALTPDSTTTSAPAAVTAVYNAGAINLLDKVAPLANSGTVLTLGDPTLVENTIRATLNVATCWVKLPGSQGYVRYSGASKSTYTAASITGDIDIRVQLNPTSWQGVQVLAAKDGSTSGNRGWQFNLNSSGGLQFQWSTAGTGLDKTASGNGPVPFSNGQVGWVRVTLIVATGVVAFYHSRDGVNWTAWGGTTAGATSIFNNSAIDYLLAQSGAGASQYAGDIHYIDVRSGVGGTTMLPTDPNSWTGTGTTPLSATTAPLIGARIKLALQQDTTGGRLVRWPANIIWPAGVAPTLSTLPSGMDYWDFHWLGDGNWLAIPLTQDTPAASAKTTIQKFTSSATFNKPVAAATVEVHCIAPGGGGGSGRRGAAGTARVGGGGGGSGARITQVFDAADLPAAIAITIGAAGTAGAAVASNDTDGAAGGAGGVTSFGSYVYAAGGNGGSGGTSGGGGQGGAGAVGMFSGGAGGAASQTGLAGGTNVAAPGSTGGGAGGGVDTTNTAYVGAGTLGGGDYFPTTQVISGGTAGNGTAGGAGGSGAGRGPLNTPISSPGGGGGGGSTSSTGGTGGTAGYGGGGGGGGASTNGAASGAGGVGGGSIVWAVIRY